MAGRIAQLLETWHKRRTSELWARAAAAAPDLDSFELRSLRSEAKGLRRQLDRVVQVADMRLKSPAAAAGLPQVPPNAEWAWRPDAWRGPLPDQGVVAAAGRTVIADNLALYHDCPLGEVIVRQVRNDQAEDQAPFGLVIEVFGFRGSFLSLAMNLPDDASAALKSRHLVQARLVIDSDRPLRAFARLNIKHGPNLAQPVSDLAADSREKLADFDLAYADINDRRIERAWADLILNDVAMTRIVIRDVVVSRRPRAEL